MLCCHSALFSWVACPLPLRLDFSTSKMKGFDQRFPMDVLNCTMSHFVHFSCVQHFATLWTVAHQVPLSVGFSRQPRWSGLPCPSPGHLTDPGIKLASLVSTAWADRFFTTSITWEAQYHVHMPPNAAICHGYTVIHKKGWL